MVDHARRASDADRERAARVLRDHAVAGRLTMEDLDGRAGQALSARTVAELDALLSDLPGEPQRAWAQTRRVLILLAEGVACVVVGVLIVTIAILLALAWVAVRLASAVAARSLPSRRLPSLSADH